MNFFEVIFALQVVAASGFFCWIYLKTRCGLIDKACGRRKRPGKSRTAAKQRPHKP